MLADPTLLAVVLGNLLANAWKFTAGRARARIRVASAERGGERVTLVEDDGIGFDAKYAHRLFSPFQRLHARSAFAGTGIGLATVKRVVTKHGGRIWVERAAENGGATFAFTLGGPGEGPG